MKKLLSSAFLLLFCANLFSQDLVINQYGDSLRCKITEIGNSYIYFQIKSEKGMSVLSLPISNVRYQYNYFSHFSKVPAESKPSASLSLRDSVLRERHKRKSEPDNTVLFSINAGPGFEMARLADNIPDELRGYYQQLRSGFNYSAGLSILFEDCIGIGVQHSSFHTSNSRQDVLFTKSDGTTQKGLLSDDITISVTGPAFTYRNVYSNGNAFFSSYYLGYVSYKDNGYALKQYRVTASTIGLGLDTGYDIELNDHFILAFQASVMMGVLKKIKYDNGYGMRRIDLSKDEYENLGRIDFNVGLRFR